MRRLPVAVAAAALLFAGQAVARTDSPVPVNLKGLAPHVAKRVAEKAREGSTALRRYLERTRMIHGLHWSDVVRED